MTLMRNILLIHCHDLGRFLGAYGVETVSTPHLDALAEESALFEQAFSTAPHCSPARASLFTGNYPQSNGVLGLTHEPFGWDLNDPTTHLAHRLKTAGYQTELVGVHHESRVLADEVVAERLGFDRARTGGARDVVVERATEALRRMADENAPFYLQVGFTEPHRVPSERDRPGVMGFLADGVDPDAARGLTIPGHLVDDPGAREEIAELQGAVRHMDEGVGSILAALDALGLRDETLVVFTTDHGLALPRAKCTLYDAGLGVAMMIRNPAHPAWRGPPDHRDRQPRGRRPHAAGAHRAAGAGRVAGHQPAARPSSRGSGSPHPLLQPVVVPHLLRPQAFGAHRHPQAHRQFLQRPSGHGPHPIVGSPQPARGPQWADHRHQSGP